MKRLALAAVLIFAGASAFADCASAPWAGDNTNGASTPCPKVGIGTSTPSTKLHVLENVDANSFLMIENPNPGLTACGVLRAKSDVATVNFQSHSSGRTISRFGVTLGGWNEFLGVTGNGLAIGTTPGAGPLVLGTNSLARITVLTDGKVGIGTATPTATLEVNGSLKATSVVGAVYQDLAEWVPATADLTPGTVVVLNASRTNEVMASSTAYDTAVAGVVSPQPGIVLGEAAPSKEMIATTGRVKVHVTAANGAIHVGDLLVTSTKPGMAMRSEPLDLGGAKLHRPGTLIGKALEPLDKGEGEILVLLSLQ